MFIEKSKMGIGTDEYYMQSYYPIFQYMYKGIEYIAKSAIGYNKDREAVEDTQEI